MAEGNRASRPAKAYTQSAACAPVDLRSSLERTLFIAAAMTRVSHPQALTGREVGWIPFTGSPDGSSVAVPETARKARTWQTACTV
jgi:hypothetical protein